MRRLLVDVNVILDALLARPPYSNAAMKLWAAAELRQVAGLVPAHGLTTVFYLISRAKGTAAARRAVADLLTVFRVAAVDQAVLQRALALAWPDFEDAVCAASAEAAGCDLIVTRDPAGFKGSPVPTVDPATASTVFDHERGPGRLAERPRITYAATRKRNRAPGLRATSRALSGGR